MADIILHETVLCFGTEGYPMGDNDYDIRYPGWAGMGSGIHLGVGFDIGATMANFQELNTLMSNVGLPKEMIMSLECAINKLGQKARDTLNNERLKEKVRITQQQALDIPLFFKQITGDYVRKGFPLSYGIMHPAIIEALNKISYGAIALMVGWSNHNFSGLGPLYDSKMSEKNDYIDQCDLFFEMMETMKSHKWLNENVKKVHGEKTPNGMIAFIKILKNKLLNNDNIIIKKGPISIEELLMPNNDTFNIAGQISNNTHNSGFDINKIKDEMALAAKKEKIDIVEFYKKIGCKQTPVFNINFSYEGIQNYYKSKTGKDYILQQAQIQLIKLGYFPSKSMANANGAYGDNTKKALIQFQTENKLGKTGVLDEDTKKILLNITKKEKGGFFDFSTDDDNNHKQEVKVKEKNLVEQFLENFKNYQPKAAVEGTDYILLFKNTALKGKGKISGSVGVGGNNKPEDVVIVRALLAKLGYLSFHIENSLLEFNMYASLEKSLCTADADLFNSIKNLQKDNGLAFQYARVDPVGASMTILNGGKIQQQTVINNNNNNITPEPGPIEQPEGKEGFQKIQTLLIKEGFLAATYFSAYSNSTVSSADGVWGNASANALLKFQKKYDLSPTAKIDKETMYFMKNRNSKPKEEEFSTVEVSAGSGFYPCFN